MNLLKDEYIIVEIKWPTKAAIAIIPPIESEKYLKI